LTRGFGKKALARRRNAGGGSKIKGGKLKMDESGTAKDAAMETALAAEVTITLEKKAGSETYHRDIKASSSAAAMHGLAVLVRESPNNCGRTRYRDCNISKVICLIVA